MRISNLVYFACQVGRMHLQKKHRVPLSAHIALTNRCNNHCVYCRVHDLPQQDVWTTASLKDILRQMRDCGTRRIHLTGGEPMLRSDLGEIITYAKKLGIFVSIVSNGYQISQRVNELMDADVVFLSYDGPPEVHSRVRGERSLKDVESSISALKSAGISVWLTTVLTRWNSEHIEEIIDFARRHHVIVNFNRLEFFLESPNHLHPLINEVQDLVLRGEERRNVFRKLIKLKVSGAPIGSSLEYLKNALEFPYDDRITDSRPSNRYTCWAGRANAHLEANGMLYACGYGVGRVPGVSVFNESFVEAWRKLVPLKDCKSCSHACMVEGNLIFSLNLPCIFNCVMRLWR